ncbi:hypothetical protein C8P66_13421 [Humitalea rosea]|uniref:Uncharacterized protein n=1 Tax=Humitalea rosea TaxID=990373 RepID=A0A2W7IHE7_9PROT|nr:hypothetical protein C8P66_13421 [Humitalea rosea]
MEDHRKVTLGPTELTEKCVFSTRIVGNSVGRNDAIELLPKYNCALRHVLDGRQEWN